MRFFHFWVPPNEKIYCPLSPEKISFIKRKSHILSVLGPPNEKISCLLSHEKISRLISFDPPPYNEISCLLSHEKISCLKRKSHFLTFLGPPPTRKSPVSCLMRKSHVSRENLMSLEKISCYSVLGHLPNEKISCLLSHGKVSCLKRKSNVLSVWGPLPMRKSPVSCLM